MLSLIGCDTKTRLPQLDLWCILLAGLAFSISFWQFITIVKHVLIPATNLLPPWPWWSNARKIACCVYLVGWSDDVQTKIIIFRLKLCFPTHLVRRQIVAIFLTQSNNKKCTSTSKLFYTKTTIFSSQVFYCVCMRASLIRQLTPSRTNELSLWWSWN